MKEKRKCFSFYQHLSCAITYSTTLIKRYSQKEFVFSKYSTSNCITMSTKMNKEEIKKVWIIYKKF
jgi:hypothetical protein